VRNIRMCSSSAAVAAMMQLAAVINKVIKEKGHATAHIIHGLTLFRNYSLSWSENFTVSL